MNFSPPPLFRHLKYIWKTGYFVCSYLVLCNNVSPAEAMRNFSVARGHSIERPNYINAIMQHGAHLQERTQLRRSVRNMSQNIRRTRWDRTSDSRTADSEWTSWVNKRMQKWTSKVCLCVKKEIKRFWFINGIKFLRFFNNSLKYENLTKTKGVKSLENYSRWSTLKREGLLLV